MRTLSALLDFTRRRQDKTLREFANILMHSDLTGEAGTLIGEIFASQEEFATWLTFMCRFAGS